MKRKKHEELDEMKRKKTMQRKKSSQLQMGYTTGLCFASNVQPLRIHIHQFSINRYVASVVSRVLVSLVSRLRDFFFHNFSFSLSCKNPKKRTEFSILVLLDYLLCVKCVN